MSLSIYSWPFITPLEEGDLLWQLEYGSPDDGMNDNEWAHIKYFKSSEKWGNPYTMKFDLVRRLDYFRELLGTRVIITYGTQGRHRPKSFHYSGQAVDVVLPDTSWHPLDIIFLAFKVGFSGVGFYSHWSYRGKEIGGYHLDWSGSPAFQGRKWLGVMEKGSQVYKALNYSNLKAFNII